MTNFLEVITVNGTAWDINFSYSHVAKPVEIITVNKLSAIYLTDDFKDSCEFACSTFLVNKERKEEEREEEDRGN